MNTTLEFRRAARRTLLGQSASIGHGYNSNMASVNWSTPVKTIPNSEQPPELRGRPYWKTGFRNGSFHKILYTPSTLRIAVGENWKKNS